MSNNVDEEKVDKLREMEQSLVINTSVLNDKLQLKNTSVSNEKLPLSISCKTKKVSNSCEWQATFVYIDIVLIVSSIILEYLEYVYFDRDIIKRYMSTGESC